jgi:hypothetical protein
MNAPIGFMLSPAMFGDVLDVGRDVRRNRATRKARRATKPEVAGNGPRFAELTSTLSEATDFKTGSVTCTAKFLIRDSSNATHLTDGETFTIRNRWTDLALASGTKVVVLFVMGEWCIIASECP